MVENFNLLILCATRPLQNLFRLQQYIVCTAFRTLIEGKVLKGSKINRLESLFSAIIDGKTHESKIAKSIYSPKGFIVAEDRIFTGYKWFAQFCNNGVHFVSLQKSNAVYRVKQRSTANKKHGLTSGQTDTQTGLKSCQCPHPLSRIGYRDPETKKYMVLFITNKLRLSTKRIVDRDKERLLMEISLRWIKTNIKKKSLIENYRNVVMTRLYVFLIAYLLLHMLIFLSKLPASLRNLLRVIQTNFFGKYSLGDLFCIFFERRIYCYNPN